MKCPKCGSKKIDTAENLSTEYCLECHVFWTDWQQERIEELEVQVAYEQERNQNNVDNSELQIKELKQKLQDALEDANNQHDLFLHGVDHELELKECIEELEKERDALREGLQKLAKWKDPEWSTQHALCVVCFNQEWEGHTPDCWLAQLLGEKGSDEVSTLRL
jgi:hypothetical protein